MLAGKDLTEKYTHNRKIAKFYDPYFASMLGPIPDPQRRKCLSCSVVFKSDTIAHRICGACKVKNKTVRNHFSYL